jgi:5-methylcytosine-specific restriction protein A
MLVALAEAIEEAPLAADPAALREGYRLLDRLAARLTQCATAVDRAGLWDLDDATSMVAWLRSEAGRTGAEASRILRVGRLAERLPVTSAAWDAGELSSAQVEVIAAHVGRHAEAFAAQEAELVPRLAACDLTGTVVAMRAWRQAADDADPAPEPEDPPQSVHLSEVGGRGALKGDLAPDTFAALRDAMAVADSGDLDLSPATRRADALDTIARFFLSHHDEGLHPRRRPRVVVLLMPEQLASGEYGLDTCDAALHRLVVSGRSCTIDYGREVRVATARQRELLDLRDHHCRWPGCDRPASWCDAHHVWFWEQGGPTDLDNLVLLCRRHHRRLHRPGYRAKLLPDATFEITRPDGTTEQSDPPGYLPAPFP